jgi:TatD DNase family protein
MKLFDSHCHLDDPSYRKDFPSVLQRAKQSGVEAVMIAGIDLASSLAAVAIANAHEGIYAAVGVHPHDAKTCDEKILAQLKKLAAGEPKVKAWGEIGLDFNRMHSPSEIQEKWFVRQLLAADELDLPLIFHERDSRGRLIALLKEHPHPRRKAVVHCFSGTTAELLTYLELGFFIGITGILTLAQRGLDLRQQVLKIPADRLLIETDAPYLTPTPQKNQTRRNEPAFVRSVLLKLAEVRKVEPKVLADTIWDNTCRLFDI